MSESVNRAGPGGRKTHGEYNDSREMGESPRSGEVHRPSEEVTIMSVTHNMDRTLVKVRWHAGGDCVVFPEELEELRQR